MTRPRDKSGPLEGREGDLSEEHFGLLVESIRDYAIFMLDPAGNVATWNSGARAIKGYTPKEILGKHLSVFYTEEDRASQKPQRLLALALTNGRVEDEGWRVRKDGSRFWADVVITALRGPEGQLIGFAKVTRDLTSRKEAEDKLRQAEQMLTATLYSIGNGVIATDKEAKITLINRVAQQLTGWPEAQALGRSIEEVLHLSNQETQARAPNPVFRVLKDGTLLGLANHTTLLSRDGTKHPIADSGAPIRDAQGNIQGAVLVFRDVSEERGAQEALRQSQERLRLMIDSVRDYAICMLDTSGHVTRWNSGAARIKGYREDEIIGAHFSRFFTPEDIAAQKPQLELDQAAREGRFEDESWRVRKDGSRFWANVIISAVHDNAGQLVGFTKVTRDLTERRKLEDERVRLAQAQEAVRLRDEFLSIASHELKTPLTALQLQLEGLRDRIGLLDDKLAKKIDKATRAGDRLGDLMETLLDVSRIATGRLTLKREYFDLVEAARDAIDRLRDVATRAGCEISLKGASTLEGEWDRLRVEQIITNLLANAIKYAPGNPIAVQVKRDDGVATIEVKDRGPGLREGDLPRIFGRFERASEPAHGGMGLGLYIAQQVAEAHGGTISAHNLGTGGACFRVFLPLTPNRSKGA